jgi:copper chaperone
MSEATIKIEGMSCGGCACRVEAAAKAVEGVSSCCVDLPKSTAKLQFDPRRTEPDKVADAITQAGYRATAIWEQLI